MKIVRLDGAAVSRLLGAIPRTSDVHSLDAIDIFDDETFVGILDTQPAKRSRAKITIKHLWSVQR